MRITYLLVFILLSYPAQGYWESYQNDLRNLGIAEGTGYFPAETRNKTSLVYGTDFQPLVSDLDNDGFNEIVIFTNNFLKLFDSDLELADESYVGKILGQPAIYKKQIVFNSRIGSNNLFFTYGFENSKLKEKAKIELANDADFGGIKCTKIGDADYCVFKDKLNYVNVIDLSSKKDYSYKTSDNNETIQTIPSIADIDADGNLEAVFWLNEDRNKGYGFLVFDLVQRKLDEGFNLKGWVDDIFAPYSSGPGSVFYSLKGQPVLVDMDKDGKMEIAGSVLYTDCGYAYCDDWFTELFVYNSSGQRLFSKCELNPSGNCHDGDANGRFEQYDGTNPFVLDSNNDGQEDICFVNDKKKFSTHNVINSSMKCYNYSGSKLVDISLSPYTNSIKFAVLADMDNDGVKDIVADRFVYSLNKNSPINYASGFSAIPVDIDGNNRLDLILSKNGMTKLILDDHGMIIINGASMSPKNPSVEDSLACSWAAESNENAYQAKVSWYKNNNLLSSEDVQCFNNTRCYTKNLIPKSSLKADDVWECIVQAEANGKKSTKKSGSARILDSAAKWNDFAKNKVSSSASSGAGYFPNNNIIRILYNQSRIEYGPLVDDIDNNGKNNIIIFANKSLIIFDEKLKLLSKYETGNLRGQFDIENMDDDAFIEIIGVANESGSDFFAIYEFDGGKISAETKFNVTNQNGFQDIRCLDFDKDGKNECIFRDYNGIVHSYGISSKNQNDDKLNVNISDNLDNVYGSDITVVPSFEDYDFDGDLDGLFWFNDNLIIIDSQKNILVNADVGKLKTYYDVPQDKIYAAKFVNIDKKANYEILAAWRNDIYKGNNYWKTTINLSLFDYKGNPIFSKVFDFDDFCSNCLGQASDIMVLDYDNDGFDDYGIQMEAFNDEFIALKFFDRNGNELFSKKNTNIENVVHKSITLADINNDDKPEMLFSERAFDLDGNNIFNYSFRALKSPLAVDFDKNNALDLLMFNEKQLLLLLDNGTYKADLSVEKKDVQFVQSNGTSIMVDVNNKGSLNVDDVGVKVTNMENLDYYSGKVKVNANSVSRFNAILSLKENDRVLVEVNYDKLAEEADYSNNEAIVEYERLPKVFVSSDSYHFNVNDEYRDYVKENLVSGYYADFQFSSDADVYIGKRHNNNNFKTFNPFSEQGLFVDDFEIRYKDLVSLNPYSGVVAAYRQKTLFGKGKVYISIIGNDVDGEIAALKKFISEQALFLNTEDFSIMLVGDDDADALKVYDFLHIDGNAEHYKGGSEFEKIVKNALNNEMFNVYDKTVVSSNGITLRLRNLKPNMSADYYEYLSSNGVPVGVPIVLSRGLWSNLTSWEVFASELANEGRDTWMIEITGGPGQDCDSCPDYTFDDLTDDYVPSLLNGVLGFTGKEKMQYVGFSNGCRSVVSSLEKKKFDPDKVETFVAVGCPGSFDGESIGSDIINKDGNFAISKFKTQGKKHLTFGDISKELVGLPLFSESKEKISLNLFIQYYNFSSSDLDQQPGKNLTLDKFAIIQGLFSNNSDLIVQTFDENAIYDNVNSDKKTYFSIFASHVDLPDRSRTKSIIKKTINNQTMSWYEKTLILKSNT